MRPTVNYLSMLSTAAWLVSQLCSVCAVLFIAVSVRDASGQDTALERLPSTALENSVETSAFYDAFFFNDSKTEAVQEDISEEKFSVEERLAKLEGLYSDLEDHYGDLDDKHSELKKKLKHLAVSGHSGSTMKVVGRIHVDHWAFPGTSPAVNVFENNDPAISPQDRLGFRRVRFGVRGELWKTMLYRIEMEFAGGDESEFRDVFIGMKDLPILQTLLIGNQKRPYGLDHLNSSRYNVFIERPFIIEALNQDARRLGIQSYGISEDQAWNWRYGVFNQRLIQDEGQYISDHYQLEVAGRMANTFWYDEASDGRGYGHWAVSGTVANPDGSGIDGRASNEARFRHRPEARSVNRWLDTGRIDGADNYRILGLENVWNFGPLQLVAEYQNLWLDRNGGSDLHFDGGYFYASYFLTGEHIPWNRSSGTLDRAKPIENFFLVDTGDDGVRGGWGAWQVAYRLSYANFNDDDIFGGRGLSHTFGLNWLWNPYTRMQFNAIYGEIDEHEGFDGAGNSLGNLSGNYTILGTRLMVDF